MSVRNKFARVIFIISIFFCVLCSLSYAEPNRNDYDLVMQDYTTSTWPTDLTGLSYDYFYFNFIESFGNLHYYSGVVYHDEKTYKTSFSFNAVSKALSLLVDFEDDIVFIYNLQTTDAVSFAGSECSFAGDESIGGVESPYIAPAKMRIDEGEIRGLEGTK